MVTHVVTVFGSRVQELMSTPGRHEHGGQGGGQGGWEGAVPVVGCVTSNKK